MAVSSSFKSFVVEQLGGERLIQARSMFGGIGLRVGELFFGLIDDDTLYFKVDDTTRPDYERLGSRAFDPFKNGQVMRGYYEVPGEVIDDRDLLVEWRDGAVGVARAARIGKKKASGKPMAAKKPRAGAAKGPKGSGAAKPKGRPSRRRP
ncbi:MAG: TfoX/Sxy family protein [Gemmatimonadales bacterium]|nr:TfoX/Sxy family protein [Gemmatimonadales bacterium]